MDAAARAELDALRARAYGPAADIDDDPAALSRLAELEGVLRREHRARDTPAVPALPSPSEAVTAAPRSETRRVGPVVAASAAVAVVATVTVMQIPELNDTGPAVEPRAEYVDAREAYRFVGDLESEVLLRITIGDSFGTDDHLPAEVPAARFPASGALAWVEPLGEHFGWNLWIASAAGALQEEHCLLIERNGVTRARCVTASVRSQSALLVPVSSREITADERAGLVGDGERIGFWWADAAEVTVLLGPDPQGLPPE